MKSKTHLIIYFLLVNVKMETLKKNYEFRNVLTKGKYYSGKNIEVFIRKNHVSKNRIGIAISKKIAKAVKRNKIKRKIRENYRFLEEKLEQGYDIVFLWKKKVKIENATYHNIRNDMDFIIKKSNLLKKKQ